MAFNREQACGCADRRSSPLPWNLQGRGLGEGLKPMSQLITTTTTEQHIEPVFDGLTPMQSAFVRAYVEAGDGNAAEAARQAGYAPTYAAVQGSRLLRNGPVQQAILIYTGQALAAHAPVALRKMAWLSAHARSEFVAQQASADILDRAGFKPPERHKIATSGGVTIDIKLE
jgi:hypothetical protein